MSPSLDFDDIHAAGPEADVWGTLATGFTLCALAFVASGIAYGFAIDGAETRDRIEGAIELGAGIVTAGLALAATLALWEAARRDNRSMHSGVGTIVLVLAAVVVVGAVYSIWHLATVDIDDRFAQLRNTEWQRTGFILFRVATGVVGAGAMTVLLRARS